MKTYHLIKSSSLRKLKPNVDDVKNLNVNDPTNYESFTLYEDLFSDISLEIVYSELNNHIKNFEHNCSYFIFYF